MWARLERYFQFEELGTNWRTEILAGVTTFVTMAYIIFVNPSILHETGMPATAVTAATCLAAAIGCLLMGIIARYPIALAPGMGLNAYFTYTVCLGMHVPWQIALGAVFLSGIIFLLLTALGIRQLILESIPRELYAAVAVGIGLFIAFIGFRNAGIIKADPATLVTLGNLRDPGTLVALFGLLLIAGLMAWGVRAAMLIGIVATTLLGAFTGLVHWNPQAYSPADLSATFFQLDLAGTMKLGLLEIVFVFLFVDLFDNIGTLVAVGTRAGLFDPKGHIPRVNRILTADAIASTAGALCGTSTVVSYIESAAGVVAGGRSGVTAIVCGLLFLVALFVAPLFGVIPSQATAPALIIVGALMLTHTEDIEWNKPVVAIPAFLTLASIPLTFSIANGLAFGFTSHTLLRVIAGEWRKVNWLVYVLTALFLLRFFYLGKG
ncbi:NCS2 family permease [uncultured Paludibaculum sp.]|uniref:NCS2 family permease n=1 Tax=uncultured Paludibaculum sp. TaxID=1765020 RepID=UPI002AAAFB8B|nr:NCS2 family permease [uncultured Paludibaculum sp.]